MLSPLAELRVGSAQIRNFFSKLDVWLSRKEPADLVDFTLESSLPGLALDKDTEIEFWLGYNPDQIWQVFAGYITEPRSPQYTAKDECLKLFRTQVIKTYQNVSPQDVLRDGLRQAGVTEYSLSPTQFTAKPRFVVAGENVSELVERVNKTWGVSYDHYFDASRRFYWDEPQPRDGPVYSYRYGENIIELDFGTDRDPHGQRAAGDTSGLGRLVTVLSPFVGHSQEIEIIWPNVGDRRFMSETVHHFINERGSLRTEIFFRELVA